MAELIQGASAVGLALAIVLLIIGLFISPWPVLLIVLVAALLLSRWLMSQAVSAAPSSTTTVTASVIPPTAPQAPPVPVSPPQAATVTSRVMYYRGVVYQQPNPSSEPGSINDLIAISGKYRGCTWKSSESDQSQGESPITTDSIDVQKSA